MLSFSAVSLDGFAAKMKLLRNLRRPFTVMFEDRSNALPSKKLNLTSEQLRFFARLLLAILGDELGGIGRAAG